MKRIQTTLKKVVSDPKKRGIDIYTQWPDNPTSTSLMFRVGSKFFTREVDNLTLTPSAGASIVKLPGNSAVAKY